MRVLVVTPWFPTSESPGTGIFNLRDVELLARDHEVRVLHLVSPDLLSSAEADYENFSILRVPFHASRPVTILTAARVIRQELSRADLLHTMAQPALIATRMVRVRVPFVHTEHLSSLVTPPSSRLFAAAAALLATLFRQPTEIVAVSSALAMVIDRHRRRPCTVIGNRVMMPEKLPNGRGPTRGRPVKIIAVGGAVQRKGAIQAVETLIELRRRGIDASLTWVGTGSIVEQMRRCAELGGESESFFAQGFTEPRHLSELLLEADLFLLPVETETFGVAIAEALAHGLPVVVTGTGGHEEFLPAEASRLVVERAPGPLADAVENLIDDPGRWDRAQIASYAYQRFSEERRREAYLSVYRSAAAETNQSLEGE